VARGKGVIRDPLIHRQVLLDVLGDAVGLGYVLCGLIRSPITGPKGNVEFLAWLGFTGGPVDSLEGWVDRVVTILE
jgi:23S rRNA (cytidine1920-2'-O)/16S rRNA (cytidine1409-2'-O)-methyltransferase